MVKHAKSICQINKEWCAYCDTNCPKLLLKVGNRLPSKSNAKCLESDKQDKNGFLDIGRDTNKLTGSEKVFYEDRGARRFWLTDEIDLEYEEVLMSNTIKKLGVILTIGC